MLFAGETVKPGDGQTLPDLCESERGIDFRVVSIEALLRMKLMAWRDKDRTHIRDMIGVGLIDASWPARLPASLGDRLQQLLNDPEG